jgi:transcriptional regulator with XRE-family HTH domain
MLHPIRRLRHERKLTLDDAARELGISKGNLSRIETGIHGASDALKRRIVEWSDGRITASDLLDYRPNAAASAA